MTNEAGSLPRSFWIVAGLALVWNALGVLAFFGDIYQTPEQIAAQGALIERLYTERPAWAVWAFGVAVFGGLAGAILLLMRRSLAQTLFILSLLGLIVQNLYWFGMAKAHEHFSASSQIMPLLVFLIAIYLVWYARSATQKGWLN